MNKLLNVSSSPHVRCSVNTQNLMLDVVIAMLPAAAFGVYNFGFHALLVLLVTSAVLCGKWICLRKTDAQANYHCRRKCSCYRYDPGTEHATSDPVWVPALGGIFAIIVVKQLYGGLGQNFMNRLWLQDASCWSPLQAWWITFHLQDWDLTVFLEQLLWQLCVPDRA